MSGVVGYLVSGYWIEEFGFEAPVWFILSCQVLCFLYLFLLPESRPKAPDAPNFFTCNSFRTMRSVFTKHRPGITRKVLYLLLASSGIFILTVLGIDGVITLYYLASPLCFSSVLIGYMYSCYTFAIATGAVTLTSSLITRFVSEFKLVVLGALAVTISMVWLAFSRYRWMIYICKLTKSYFKCYMVSVEGRVWLGADVVKSGCGWGRVWLAQLLRSLLSSHKVPSSIPGSAKNICATFLSA